MARQLLVARALMLGIFVSAVAGDPAPGPSMPNTAANCNKWFLAKSGDSCATAQAAGGISATQFFAWNPDVSKDCLTNFWPTYYYCIGVGAAATTTTTKTTTTTTRTTTTSRPTSGSSTTSRVTSSVTSSVNATYSIKHPITSWNITTKTIGSAYPPKETQPGQPSYCIDWHLVGIGETCQMIVNRYSTLGIDDLLDWNPALLDDCSGLQIGFYVCVRIQPRGSMTLTFLPPSGNVSIPPSTAWTPPVVPTVDPNFTPTPTPGPIPATCQAYYKAKGGDRCDNVLAANPMITREQFFSWNPALRNNCDGLWAGYYYCVFAGPKTTLPDPPIATAKPGSGVPADTAADCKAWYQVTGGDTCDLVVEMFGRFSKADFIKWNPSLRADCAGIRDDTWYCVGVPSTPTTRTAPLPSSSPTAAPPQQSGIAKDCTELWLVSTLDDCRSITRAKGITLADFLRWNPAVGATECDKLLPGYDVCVKAGAAPSSTSTGGATSTSSSTPPTTTRATTTTTTTRTTTTTTTTAGGPVSTPAPILPGMLAGCRRFYFTRDGDGCWAIANSAGISLDDFIKWNPSAKSDCSGLWRDVYVCIGMAGPTTTISGGPPVPTK